MTPNPGVEPSSGPWGEDTAHALVIGPRLLAPIAAGGPLSGLTLVAKDLFDVAGWPTGAGNPDWLADASPASDHATAVSRLIAAGAALIGKAHTDELAYSLSGRNAHYGAPLNCAAPGRLPGGSSSGSAAAVAAGLADLGLGSDTGGSLRVPASYCGLFGLRPTHGRVSLAGAVALAPSFDTAGLLARSAQALRAGMRVLLDDRAAGDPVPPVHRLVVADDAVAMLDEDCRDPWEASLAAFGLPQRRVRLAEGERGLAAWRVAYQRLQGAEAWTTHGPWFEQRRPRVSPDVEQRFRAGGAVTEQMVAEQRGVRDGVSARLRELLEPGDALVLPSACGVAPRRDLEGEAMDGVRRRLLNLTSAAGLAGAPGLSLPLARVEGLPLGVCLVGRPGDDEALLDLAVRVEAGVAPSG